VLNALLALGHDPLVVTSRTLLNVDQALAQHVVDHGQRFWDQPEVLCLAFNRRQQAAVAELVRGKAIRFIYQRYARWNVVGADVADRLNVPLVLEYNGSELWVAEHWGSPIARRALAEQIELVNLRAAAIVVVVSEPMRTELLGRGVDPGAILVTPNGVDTDVYRPDVDGSRVRRELDLERRIVVGFIGTFGAWHGTQHLTGSALELLTARPDLRDRVVFLMVGDGPHLEEVRRTIADAGAEASFRLTGLVPQEQGPEHLAAADILVAPHQPNRDGSPFFGSPTKLFEYMAMGRGIVASDLDQIGEVLTDGHSALLVPPEDPRALAHALARLIDDPPLRARLGSQARRDAIERHTWRAHTTRILDAVERLPR
jgi:glycosyltransferase involved in cell wall biosynthesis